MGAYLSTPLTDKESSDEINELLSCGASQMQGWRMSQEDAHICALDFDKSTSLFAVFDGHGGSEVALYCSKNLPNFLKNTEAYKNSDYEQALKDTFIGFDATLITPDVINELKKLVPADKVDGESETEEDGDGDDEEDLTELCQESRMPLNELLEKYKDGKNPLIKLKQGEASGSKPQSPYLRGRRNDGAKENCSNGESSSVDSSAISCRKIDVNINEEEETVSSSSASANIGNDERPANEASSSTIVASGDGGGGGSSSSLSASAASSSDVNPDNCTSNGPSSSSTLKIESADKTYCNSPDSSSTKNTDNQKESTANGSAESSSDVNQVDGKQTVNGSVETSSSTRKSGTVESQVSEVSTYSFKGENVTSSSTSVVTVTENDIVSTNTEAGSQPDKSQNNISSTKNLPLIDDDDSSSGDEEGDASYNEDKSTTDDDDGDDCEEEADDSDDEEEEDDSESDELYPRDFDEDEKFLNNMLEGPGSSSGCTAVVALLAENELYVANAGDSRCVVCRNGTALDMSLDHKPEDTEELERIRKAGGRVTMDGRVNGGLNLSRAIGDHAYKMNKDLKAEEQMISALPDVKRVTITADDEFMILACDGIWNSLSSEQVVKFVRTRILDGQTKMSTICEELFTKCLAPNTSGDGTGCDNMTAVIVQFKPLLAEQNKNVDTKNSVNVTTSTTVNNKRSASPGALIDESNTESHKRIKTDQSEVTAATAEPTST